MSLYARSHSFSKNTQLIVTHKYTNTQRQETRLKERIVKGRLVKLRIQY